MRTRLRAWLVALIADGVTQANQKVDVQIDGRHLVAVLNKERRMRGGRAV